MPPDTPSPPDRRNRPGTRSPAGGATFFKFVLLVNLVARPFARVHERAHGIRLTEWRVLRALSLASGPITAGVLGDALGLDKMAVSRAVRALEARNRLHRGPDPADGRRIALEISEEGRALVARIEPSGRDREAQLLAALTPEERAILGALMDRLVRLARDLPDPTAD